MKLLFIGVIYACKHQAKRKPMCVEYRMPLRIIKSTPFTLIFLLLFTFQGRATELEKFYYNGEEELALEGDWMFYWGQLLYSGDSLLESSGFSVKLPNYWNNHKNKGYVPSSFGYATYRAIIVSDRTRDIAMEYTGPHCAQRIYLNGELLVTTGKVGTTLQEYKALWLPGVIKTHLEQGENELIIQISNFSHSKGGIYKVPIIGEPTILFAKRDSRLLLDSFVAGGLFLMGLFFLGLSIFWKNNRLFSYFGLFISLFSLWYINYGTHAFKVYFTSVSWDASIRLTYMAFYGSLFFFSLFVYEVFKHHFDKIYLKIILAGYALLFLMVIFCSPCFFTSNRLYLYILVIGQFIYAIILLVFSVRVNIEVSIIRRLIILVLSLFLSVAFGALFTFLPKFSEFLGLLFLVVFLFFAILMAKKVGGDYRNVLQLQKKAVVQKEKIQEQAVKLQLLDEMKTRFFANVSHDLRSPLTLIKGSFYKIKKENQQLTEEFKSEFLTIDKNVNQLIQFTDEIRDLNLLDQRAFLPSFTKIEVNSFLKSTFDMFQSFADTRKINLLFRSEHDEITIHGDEKKIRKALNNLISNAFKFTNDCGRIELAVKKIDDGILLTLLDTGVGIEKEEQPFVFDRFYQGKQNAYRSEEGMGIGLAMVRELISLHEGTVNLESKVGKGSIFTIFLPYNYDKSLSDKEIKADENQLSDIQTDESRDIRIDFKPKEKLAEQTILLVDDHHDVRRYIASVINKQYYVIEAKNGAEAYDILKQQKIDLVITDLMMPWMDGFELIDKMNADTKLSRVKIMVVSARTTQEDKLKVLNKGVNEFISKPFDEEEFNKRVSNILIGKEPSMLYDLAEKKGKYSDIEENVLLKVNDLIMDQIDNSKFTISILADKLATSERNANRIIKKLTGLPPKVYIQKVRMNYAEILMKEKKVKSLTEAGKAVGIKNATQFAKQFEKIMGYAPPKV